MNELSGYSHAQALAQAPVRFRLHGNQIVLRPLTVSATLDIDGFLRFQYQAQFDGQIELYPEDARADFVTALLDDIEGITYQHGKGSGFLLTDVDSMVYFVRHLCRFDEAWPENRIKEVLFPGGINEDSLGIFTAMRAAVYRSVPPFPVLNIASKPDKYESTSEENEVRNYRILFDKFHWTFAQVLDLTEYQIAWCRYMLPEEREQREALEETLNRSSDGNDGAPLPPGQIHFNSSAEYEAWLAEKAEKGEKTREP